MRRSDCRGTHDRDTRVNDKSRQQPAMVAAYSQPQRQKGGIVGSSTQPKPSEQSNKLPSREACIPGRTMGGVLLRICRWPDCVRRRTTSSLQPPLASQASSSTCASTSFSTGRCVTRPRNDAAGAGCCPCARLRLCSSAPAPCALPTAATPACVPPSDAAPAPAAAEACAAGCTAPGAAVTGSRRICGV